MAVISEVKCGRCDRRYSGFRSRCPYCGARRNKRGKHADEADNSKAKLVIGIMLLVLLIAATMVLILTSLPDQGAAENPTDSAVITTDTEATDPEDNVTAVENSNDPGATETPSPSASAPVEIGQVIIIWDGDGQPRSDITIPKVGDSYQMDFVTIPETTDKIATWESSDPEVFMVLSNGKITATGKGSATLTCTVDGIIAKCIVRVKGA